MQIEVLSVSQPTFTATEKGGYNKIEVAYKADGKVQGKVLVDFGEKAVYEFFKQAKQGDIVDVVSEKNGKYWNWTSCSAGATSAGKSSEGTATAQGNSEQSSGNDGNRTSGRPAAQARGRITGSNYETPEERAKRQVYIVRQSSISAAINTLARDGTKELDCQRVIEIAKVYEAFVFGADQPQTPQAVGEEDVPF